MAKTYTAIGTKHDDDAKDIRLDRDSFEDAMLAARLMSDCGYETRVEKNGVRVVIDA